MRSALFIVIALFLTSGSLSAEVITREGALNLVIEAEGYAVNLSNALKPRPLNDKEDSLARQELLGLAEVLGLLRADLEAGVSAPRRHLLLVEKSHQALLPVQGHMALDPRERKGLERMFFLLRALDDYRRQTAPVAAQPPPPATSPQPVATEPPTSVAVPQGNWQPTPLGWCQVKGKVTVVAGQPPVALPASLSPRSGAVKIKGDLSGLRLRASSSQPDPGNVALAFLDENTNEWVVHQADFDPRTGWVETSPSHCSWWQVVAAPFARLAKTSAHCKIHFFPNDDTMANIETNLNSLEEAWSRLEGLGLRFSKNRIDVYYRDLDPEVSAAHVLGKFSGSWIELNKPSRSQETALGLKGTMGHELFHEIHSSYEHHLRPGSNAIIAVNGGHAFQWLNEALSSWFEFDFVRNANYQGNCYANASDFHLKGLGRLNKDDGYGGALFIDYLVKLHGREFLADLMRRVSEQGGPQAGFRRNSLNALGDAVFDRARNGDLKYSDLDGVWEGYVDELMAASPTAEPRIRRRSMLPLEFHRKFSTRKSFSFQQAPLSVGPVHMLEIPRDAAGEDGAFGLLVNFHTSADFPVFTRVYLADDIGRGNSILGPEAGLLYTLDRQNPGGSGNIQLEPDDTKCIVLLVPYALSGKRGDAPVSTTLEVAVVQRPPQEDPVPEEPAATTPDEFVNPRVGGVTPNEAAVFSTITVYGSGFGSTPPGKATLFSGNAVVFIASINGRETQVAAPVVRWTPTAITVRVPPANYNFYSRSPSGRKGEKVGIAVSRNRQMSNVTPFFILE